MPKPVISVSSLGKRFELRERAPRTLRDAIPALFKRRPAAEAFWALRNASFDIAPGEIVGIVGNNGAGKSTLLKILSRITPPTEGTARISGRIGSLLEVGTGFHPELSGRDNIFMNGLLLGMSPAEIRGEFDRIVDFSGVGDFIDVPVKHYSSGMYLRLAFAVAAHLRANILMIDEILAVGDIAFQKKCLARMDEVAHQGRTILFVSHNLTAIQALCGRTIWIDGGRVAADGDTREVVSAYLHSATDMASARERSWALGEGPASEGVELQGARVLAGGKDRSGTIDVRTAIDVQFEFRATAELDAVDLGFRLTNDEGVLVFDVGPTEGPVKWAAGVHRLGATIPGNLLNEGMYRIGLKLFRGGRVMLEIPNLLTFEVLDTADDRHGWYGKWHGVVRPRFDWTHEIQRLG